MYLKGEKVKMGSPIALNQAQHLMWALLPLRLSKHLVRRMNESEATTLVIKLIVGGGTKRETGDCT